MRWLNPLMLLMVVFLAACGDEKPVNENASIAAPKVLPVTHVLVKDTNLFREYVADIQAVQNVELRARVQGFLERIYVDEGQVVKKGQLLAEIDATKEYPYQYVCFKITEYRPDAYPDLIISGADLVSDRPRGQVAGEYGDHGLVASHPSRRRVLWRFHRSGATAGTPISGLTARLPNSHTCAPVSSSTRTPSTACTRAICP